MKRKLTNQESTTIPPPSRERKNENYLVIIYMMSLNSVNIQVKYDKILKLLAPYSVTINFLKKLYLGLKILKYNLNNQFSFHIMRISNIIIYKEKKVAL